MVRLALALQLFAAHADGQTYPVPGGPLLHSATKAAASLAVYAALRAAKAPKPVAALVSTLGVAVVAKGVERAKGHTLGPLDTAHDLLWHTLPVVSVTLKLGTWQGNLSAGLATFGILATCQRSSPRWC